MNSRRMKKGEYMRRAVEFDIRGRSRMTKEELKKNITKVMRKMRGGGLNEDDINLLLNRDYQKNPMIYREYDSKNILYKDYRIYDIRKTEIPITYQQGDGILWKRENRDILHIYFYRYDNFDSRIRGKHLSNGTEVDVNKRLFISPDKKILVRLNQIRKNRPLPRDMFTDAMIPPIQKTREGKEPYYNLSLKHNLKNEEKTPDNVDIEMVDMRKE